MPTYISVKDKELAPNGKNLFELAWLNKTSKDISLIYKSELFYEDLILNMYQLNSLR